MHCAAFMHLYLSTLLWKARGHILLQNRNQIIDVIFTRVLIELNRFCDSLINKKLDE